VVSASYRLLAALVSVLEELGYVVEVLLALDSEFGWSVSERLADARELEAGLVASAWERELPAIRVDFPDFAPQAGLLPLGRDPDSDLWEFAHLLTGAPAMRDADDELVLEEETGVVLVLIPGGSTAMGAKQEHEKKLPAYFLSKFELTQGQWKHVTGKNPSSYGVDGRWEDEWLWNGASPSLLHPMTNVSWSDCMKWLPRVGLTLPGEAQWENGARAGTHTAFWSGPTPKDLEGVANVADDYASSHGLLEASMEHGFEDGATFHWEVGSARANAFGLHDVHGNVLEWCLEFDAEFLASNPRLDPAKLGVDQANRPYRSGCFRLPARAARSFTRNWYPPTMAGDALGVRPARALD
jgi:formylglycine-generating enzyme required for sulfatase activity